MNGPITFRSRNGMLHSSLPIGDVLREKLGKRACKCLAPTIRFAEREKWVVYGTDILVDRELDDKLAHDLGFTLKLPPSPGPSQKVTICHPKTVQLLQGFKRRTVKFSKDLGYEKVTKTLFAPSRPADLRRKWYEILDHALDVDERAKDFNKSAFNLSLFLSSLSIGLNDKGEACSKLTDRLWLDPKHDDGQFFDWLSYNGTEPGNGSFKETPYYNDRRFLELLDDVMIENRDLMFRK